MLVIGLTGGIGSGKTTVAQLFAEKGITVIDTDQLARNVTQIGKPALQQISEQFGQDILQADGSLNRTLLRKKIFADETNRLWLENLLHPLIRAELNHQVHAAKTPYCIVVVPLLVETEKNPLINRVLVIDAPENEQLIRTQLRDNISKDDVKTILQVQISRAQRLQAADDVIENTGTIKDLLPQIDRLHGFYTALALK